MTPEQYAASQAVITAGLAGYVQRFASLFTAPLLTPKGWLDLLSLLFPEVERRYMESASLGRVFYDSQRALHHPTLERNERLLSETKFEWFVKNMEPAKKEMLQANSPKSAVSKVVLTAVREVEMAARRQVIAAVKEDAALERKLDELQKEPEVVRQDTAEFVKPSKAVSEARAKAAKASDPNSDLLAQVESLLEKRASKQIFGQDPDAAAAVDGESFPTSGTVIGWARVATGRETCAWCLMLISRGAELNHKGNFGYREAATAGISLDDGTVLSLYEEAGGDLKKFREMLVNSEAEDESFMEQWHVGCDCLAVPVFDIDNWPGKDQSRDALQLWIDASKEASDLIDSGKSRTTNKYTETLNALRRRLERGEISMTNYALAA